MKIAQIIFNLCLGGSETMLLDIMECQVKQGHDVSLVLINRGHNETLISKIPPQVNVVYINRPNGSVNPWYHFKLNGALKRIDPDIVHAHNNRAFVLIWKRKNVKYLITAHDTGLEFTYAKNVDAICAISNAVRKDLKQRYGVESQLVYNGIKTKEVAKRQNSELEGHKFKILQISRLYHDKKGQDILIKAVAHLKNKGFKDITIDLIGSGPSMEYLNNLAKTNGIVDAVNFLGERSRSEVYAMIQNYDLLVQPSIYEGFGLTVVEGMAAKVPVLVSNNDGPIEIIENNKYGCSFENGNYVDCANKIEAIINNYSYYSELAQTEAYNRAIEDFDIARTAEKYCNEYAKIING